MRVAGQHGDRSERHVGVGQAPHVLEHGVGAQAALGVDALITVHVEGHADAIEEGLALERRQDVVRHDRQVRLHQIDVVHLAAEGFPLQLANGHVVGLFDQKRLAAVPDQVNGTDLIGLGVLPDAGEHPAQIGKRDLLLVGKLIEFIAIGAAQIAQLG